LYQVLVTLVMGTAYMALVARTLQPDLLLAFGREPPHVQPNFVDRMFTGRNMPATVMR
jgi:hypothetical protein